MAGRSLGVLTLDLVANIGGYTKGLDSAEREAKKRSQAIERAFDNAASVAGAALAAIGAAGVAAFAVLNREVEKLADFQDLSDKIGDTAESIATLKLAADVSGTSFETIAAASVRLSATLAKTDDEAKGAGAAVKALGLDLEAFKKQTPVDQLETVARALAGFEDGAEKTAVAVALLGKSGAELLPFLKDLSEEGRTQNGITAEQIRLADEYTKANARLRSDIESFVAVQAGQVVPTLTQVQQVIAQLIKDETTLSVVTGVLDGAMKTAITIFQTLAVVGSDVGFVFLSVGREIGAWAAQIAAVARGDLKGFRAISDAVKEDGERARRELDKFQQRIMQIGQPNALTGTRLNAATDPRSLGIGSGGLPRLNTSGLGGPDKAAKKQAEEISEASRALASYVNQLDRTLQKTEELTETQKALDFLRGLGATGEIPQVRELVLTMAERIDKEKELNDEIKLRRELIAAEGDAVNAANEAYQNRIKALTDANPSEVLKRQKDDIVFLNQAYQDGAITYTQYGEAVIRITDEINGKTEKQKTLAEELGLTFTSAFEDAIVSGGNLRKILSSIEQDIVRLVTRRLVTEPFGKWFNGALDSLIGGGGGNRMAGIGGIDDGALGAILGTNRSGGGIGGFFGNAIDSLGKFFGFFADGGVIPAGGWGIAGEAGPEVIRGPASVTPMGAMGGVTVNNTFVMPQTYDRRTQQQVASDTYRSAGRAAARYS